MKDLLALNKVDTNALSFHKVVPFHAFGSLNFGANPYGINLATPPDNCHQINKGVIERLPEIFLARLPKKMVDSFGFATGETCSSFIWFNCD